MPGIAGSRRQVLHRIGTRLPLRCRACGAERKREMALARFEIDSDRLNWRLDQTEGVPGLPSGVAVLPSARSHASVLRMMCGSGKTFTVRMDLHRLRVGLDNLIVAVMCGQLFTRATGTDWEAVYGKENVYVYLDGKGKGKEAKAAKQRLGDMCRRGRGVIFISIESFLELDAETLPETASIGALLRMSVREKM